MNPAELLILIIDDEPELIALAGSILRSEGYRISAVTSAKAAFHYLKEHHPDLILLDIHMEGMDGIEVCRKLKSTPETEDIPVIFLTAENHPHVIRRSFQSGGCDYIVKPFIREEFLARVQTHLQISQNAHALTAANQELRQFCSAVSHDLRSPLNVLNMLILSLDEELGNARTPEVAELMGMIQDKSEKLILMITRLLEFSRMCNVIPEIRPLSLQPMAEQIFRELHLLCPERDISFQVQEIPTVYGDPVLIEILLKNILSNAIKFTGCRERAEISITSERTAAETILHIKDNGAGFDMQYAGKLFQIFQRLHTEEEYEGTGVGLALCARIMKRHGGNIQASGKPDGGAVITLYFPNHQKRSEQT